MGDLGASPWSQRRVPGAGTISGSPPYVSLDLSRSEGLEKKGRQRILGPDFTGVTIRWSRSQPGQVNG